MRSYDGEGTRLPSGTVIPPADASKIRARPPYRLPSVLYAFTWSLPLLMLPCFAFNLYWRRVENLRFEPYATPLFMEYFPDFVNFIPRFRYFHSVEFFRYPSPSPFMYPAPVGVVYAMFYAVPKHPLAFFLLFGATALGLGGLLFGRVLVRRGIRPADAYIFPLAVMLCSYPVWFAAKQANMEIVIWIAVSSGLAFYLLNRGYSAAVCFGIAASMKIYPLVYLGLLLIRRQYREVATGVLVAVGATLASLWMMDPDLVRSWKNTSAGLDRFRVLVMLHKPPQMVADHSLFAVLKRGMRTLPPPEIFGHVLTAYLATVAVLGLLLFLFRIWKLPVLNQILCLTIASILFPPTSFEYTLLHLFFPFALYVLLLIDCQRRGQPVPGLRFLLPCFALLFGFIPEVIVHGTGIGGQIKALLLLGMFVFALWKPLPEAAFGSDGDGAVGGERAFATDSAR